MDFIDFDTFTEEIDLPQPQPPLSLPINITSNLTNNLTTNNLSINFKKITQNLLNQTNNSDFFEKNDNFGIPAQNENDQIDGLAERYAKLSIDMINNNKLTQNDKQINELIPNDKIRSNALSSRLSRILNNSSSDNVIKESLTLLQSSLNESNSSNIYLIETGILGSITRRKLRSDIENDLINIQSSILDNYKPIYEKIILLQHKLNDLSSSYNNISSKLLDSDENNLINNEIKDLIKEKYLITIKKKLLINFKKTFTINEYEEHYLRNNNIDEEFLAILLKIETIYKNCSILLSMNNQNLGIKIMSQMSTLIDLSIERIIKYINNEFKNISPTNSNSIFNSSFFKKILSYLNYKNEILNNLVSNFIETRSNFLNDDFLAQINGNDDSSNRPIILSAHDPVRFCGDLLAYIHSIVVNEKDLISNIFNFDIVFEDLHSLESLNFTNEIEFKLNDSQTNAKILNSILSKLTKHLFIRIEQILQNENKLTVIDSIYNLLELYELIFSKNLSPDQELIVILKKLIQISQERNLDIIQTKLKYIESIKEEELDLNFDLQPPEWIIDFYSDLLPIIDSSTNETFMNFDADQVAKLESCIIEKPIELFDKQILSELPLKDKLILKLNFFDLIISKILPINILSNKVLMINDMINQLTTELTNYEINSIMESNNLIDYSNLINMICPFSDDFFDVSIYQPITENKLFTKENLSKIDLTLQEFLPTCIIDIQQSLIKLNSPITVNDVIINSSISFINFMHKFQLLCAEYLDEQVFKWNDLEIATLLGVDEPYLQQKSALRFD